VGITAERITTPISSENCVRVMMPALRPYRLAMVPCDLDASSAASRLRVDFVPRGSAAA